MRTAEELRGSSASLSRAWKRSSSVRLSSLATRFSSARLPANCAVMRRRRLFFSIELFFAISACPESQLLAEREVEGLEQRARFVVAAGRRAYDHVHAPDLIHVVVVDLRENDVLLDAHREVAAPVEA